MPSVELGADLGPIKIIYREGYVLGHSAISRIPYWVCEHSTANEVAGPANRDNSKFLPDPDLTNLPRAELSDYKGSGYDRGHMVPAGDFKFSQARMDESFYLSNMIPQFGPTFNRGIWAQLEDTVRQWVKKRGECWIVSGPLFYDPLEEDPETADGMILYFTIGENDVAVPTHTFKIVLAKNGSAWEAIAFVFENRRFGKPYRLAMHRTTIDWIEKRTGLDFFPDLTNDPSLVQTGAQLESKKSPMWETE